VFFGKELQLASCPAVVLDKDEVPYLYHQGVPRVHHEMTRSLRPLAVTPKVDMYLRAGATWSGIAHLPEVVFFGPVDYVVFGTLKTALPVSGRLIIPGYILFGVAFKDSGIDPFHGDAEHGGEKLPCPFYGLLLEVVAERPVAEHLEHGVVIGVNAYLLEIIVFSRHPQALL